MYSHHFVDLSIIWKISILTELNHFVYLTEIVSSCKFHFVLTKIYLHHCFEHLLKLIYNTDVDDKQCRIPLTSCSILYSSISRRKKMENCETNG